MVNISKLHNNKRYRDGVLLNYLFVIRSRRVRYNCDERFKIFSKDDVLDTFTKYLTPSISKAGRVPEDYNVEGQNILRYKKNDGKMKI